MHYLRKPLLCAAFVIFITVAAATDAATYLVTNKADAGAGSLRQAILDANANPGRDVIGFEIAGAQPWNILLDTELPGITDTVLIDGTTQPGYAGEPVVGIAGANALAANGLTLNAFDCEVRGLVVNRFKGDGIRLQGGGRHKIAGNFIGTAMNGNASLGNRYAGVTIMGSVQNVIGGTNAADRNLISGNQTGVYITGFSAISNVVQGNFIGTDIDGVSDLGNTNNGVLLHETTGNKVGGSSPGARNVISGNNQSGIYFLRATNGNQVCGNYIGTTLTGLAALSNRLDGVKIDSSAGNLIGGGAGEGNVISGNRERGVYLISGSRGNRIEGNLIGLAASGTSSLGNGYAGIGLAGASWNAIGGTNVSARNVIAGNLQSGVVVSDAGCAGNVIAGNFIGTDASGSNAVPNAFSGISISQGTNNVVGGSKAARNVISGNAQNGVHLQAGVTIVSGNYIGTDVTGQRALRNGQSGVRVDSAGNLIGGSTADQRNVISGNGASTASGVLLAGSGASNNVVAGNFIGTDSTGATRLPNSGAGVGITNAQRNWIGGPGLLDGNLISGNTDSGIYLTGAGTAANRISGNLIGTDAAGIVALSNGFGGIYVYGAPSNTFSKNVISGNSKVGVFIMHASANGNVLQENMIGLQRNGTGLLGNEWHGIELTNVLYTAIGGIAPGAGNRIGGARTAGYDGVRIRDNTSATVIRGNSFFGNGGTSGNGLGIDLGVDGVTLNDMGDLDNGANGLQNFPVLTATSGRYRTMVSGMLNSRANGSYTIDFYGNANAEPSGYGEGERWLGSIMVTTDASGNGSFAATLTNWFGAGPLLTATATDVSGNTSEFGLAVAMTAAADTDGDGLPDDYEVAAGLNPGVADASTQDSDGDGVTDRNELAAGTNPVDASDVLRVRIEQSGVGIVIAFQSVNGRTYDVLSAMDLSGPWLPITTAVAGTGTEIQLIDPQAKAGARFFTVRVN